MEKPFQYYRGWLSQAFCQPLGLSDLVAGIIGVLGAAIVHFFPDWERSMSDLAWQLPVGLFGGLAGPRLFLAPYWMYKEQTEKNIELTKRLNEIESLTIRVIGRQKSNSLVSSGNGNDTDGHDGTDR